jgi:hypothetical protein
MYAAHYWSQIYLCHFFISQIQLESILHLLSTTVYTSVFQLCFNCVSTHSVVFIRKNEVENVLDNFNKLKVYYNEYIMSSEILEALGDSNGPYYIKLASV